jgi:hypothetical protein
VLARAPDRVGVDEHHIDAAAAGDDYRAGPRLELTHVLA